MIFVAVAIGWAGYLIPKALAHHDELAKSRSVDRFSHKVRVLRRTPAETGTAAPAPAPVPTQPSTPSPEPAVRTTQVRRYRVSREAAHRAARRRRRIALALLVLAGAAGGAAYAGYLPIWSPAVPFGVLALFFVLARVTLRRQRRIVIVEVAPDSVESAAASGSESTSVAGHIGEVDLDTEDTMGLSRDELAAVVASPDAAEGSLWDPLPVTLPTYVGKARARRTVRTIELTSTGVTSSGHDPADSALVRSAEAAVESADAGEPAAHLVVPQQRKAAGA